MADKYVLDTSAIIALLNDENGCDIVRQYLKNAIASVVNEAEVYTVLARNSYPFEEFERIFFRKIIPFTSTQAKITGELISQTKSLGLSLGDRACLALAIEQNLPVLTADKAWENLKLPIEIRLIR